MNWGVGNKCHKYTPVWNFPAIIPATFIKNSKIMEKDEHEKFFKKKFHKSSWPENLRETAESLYRNDNPFMRTINRF